MGFPHVAWSVLFDFIDMADSMFGCLSCCKEFSGPIPLAEHVQSKKHGHRVLQTLLGRKSPVLFICHPCGVSLEAEQLVHHVTSDQHIRAAFDNTLRWYEFRNPSVKEEWISDRVGQGNKDLRKALKLVHRLTDIPSSDL